MTDAAQTISTLLASYFQDGQTAGSIVPSRMRDFVLTTAQQRNTIIYAGAPEYAGGVKANGSTDDTAAWTSALAAAASAGGATVLAPVGTSIVTSITIPSNVRLSGMPTMGYYFATQSPITSGSIIHPSATSATPVIQMNAYSSIYGITINGAGTGNQDGIFQLGSNVYIEYCNILNCNNAVNHNYHDGAVIGCRLGGNNNGIENPTDVIILGNIIYANLNAGIFCGPGAQSTTIVGNIIEWNNHNNIEMWSPLAGNGPILANTISCNRMDAAGYNNISMTGCFHCSVTGNTLTRSGRQATRLSSNDAEIYLHNCYSCTVTGNVSYPGVNDDGSNVFGPYYTVYGGGGNATAGGDVRSTSFAASTTNASTTLTITSRGTSGLYAGIALAGTNIAGGATISSITNATQVVMSAAATGTGATTVTISGVLPSGPCLITGNDLSYAGARDNTDSTLTFSNNTGGQMAF